MKKASSYESLHQVSPESGGHPSFGEAFRFWLKLGFISFGGPTGQIAVMHAELVEKKKWISEARFLHALNYCMLLPSPEHSNWLPMSTGFCTKRGVALLRELSSLSRRSLFSGDSAISM